MTGLIRMVARAKLTLSLRVLGVRPDGFHELEALVVSVGEPADSVYVRLLAGTGHVEGPTVPALRIAGPAAHGLPRDETNLALRAARAVTAEPVQVTLHKGIPAGAGLGGGSADAAAVLAALRHLDAGPAGHALHEIAATLGSDVPFCLGGGLAWMRGRGERIEPLAPVAGPELVIAVPPFPLATPAVYRAWDELDGPQSSRSCPPPNEDIAALLPDGLVNDLEPAAEAVEPRLRPFREALEAHGRGPAVMAGSGSAYFIPVPAGTNAVALAAGLARATGAATWATRPVRQGVELVG